MNHKLIKALSVTLIGLPGFALAAPTETTASPYLGGSYGYYRLTNDSDLTDLDEFKDESSAWKAFAGVDFNRVFGLEIAHIDLSDAKNHGWKLKVDGQSIAALVGFPILDSLRLYGKIGQFFWDTEASNNFITAKDDGDDTFYGAGVQLGITPGLNLRLEYERYEISSTDIDLPSISAVFSF